MAVGFCCKKVVRKEGSIAIGNVMSMHSGMLLYYSLMPFHTTCRTRRFPGTYSKISQVEKGYEEYRGGTGSSQEGEHLGDWCR